MHGYQMSVVRHHENAIAHYGGAAVGAFGGISGNFAGAVALVMPDGASSLRVDGENLIGASHVHNSVDDKWCQFEDEVVDGEDPLHHQIFDIGGSDLVEVTIAIAAELAMIG